jgi:hypothetical protein
VPLLNIASWELLPPATVVKRVRAPKSNGPGTIQWNPKGSIKPADLYCYLKARFGEPNGLVMFAAPPSSDNIIHWHYTLASGNDTLHIQGISSRVQFMASSLTPLRDADWQYLVARLKEDFSHFGLQMRKVRNDLERWTIFVNPYFRLESIVADLHARLASLSWKSAHLPEFPTKQSEFKSFQKNLDRLTKKYSKTAELGMSLRMITPVWGESFVNLIIFLLAKNQVKSNDQLYQNIIRKKIRIRASELHLHCDGFAAPLDRDSDTFRDFLTVFNSRNDFLHGNVDPKLLAVDEIFFEGKMPLFMHYQTFTERSLAPRLKYLEPEVVKKDIYRIEAFIAYVLGQLEPSVSKSVRLFMETPLPGWRPETGRPGILFSDIVADIIIPDEELSDY